MGFSWEGHTPMSAHLLPENPEMASPPRGIVVFSHDISYEPTRCIPTLLSLTTSWRRMSAATRKSPAASYQRRVKGACMTVRVYAYRAISLISSFYPIR